MSEPFTLGTAILWQLGQKTFAFFFVLAFAFDFFDIKQG
jgi:hypothetical protein